MRPPLDMDGLGRLAVAAVLGMVGWYMVTFHWPEVPRAPRQADPLEQPELRPDQMFERGQNVTRRVMVPSTRTAPLTLPGCGEGDPRPTGPTLQEEVRLVGQELLDRAFSAWTQDSEASEELQEGFRQLFVHRDWDEGLRHLRHAPDRKVDGFDHALAAAFVTAVHFFGERNSEAGHRFLREIDVLEPGSPLKGLALAVDARHRGDAHAEVAALRVVHSRDPENAAVALSLAAGLMRIGESAEALEVLEAYEAMVPDDPWSAAVRPRLEQRAEIEAGMVEVLRDGVTLRHARRYSARDMQRVHLLVLESLEEAAQLFEATRRPELLVVVYGNRAEFARVTCGPGWSGARYDGALRIPARAIGSDRERVTIRHEALHAELAYHAPRSPLWLHEGVAQLFQGALPSDLERSMDLMARERTYVPFPSIEGSFMVIDDADSARFAYHQSYAMVAAIVDREGSVALQRAVAHLQSGAESEGLLKAMSDPPLDGDALLAWIESRR